MEISLRMNIEWVTAWTNEWTMEGKTEKKQVTKNIVKELLRTYWLGMTLSRFSSLSELLFFFLQKEITGSKRVKV